jgi:tetratricopeptide (TPR) repeat protein
MDVEKKHPSKLKKIKIKNMKKFLKNILCVSLISFYFIKIEKVQSIVPYYYLPSIKNLQKESLAIGKNAYQLLYFGQFKESLNLAKLAVKINSNDEKLWLILSEAQVANKLYTNALISLDEALKINSNNSEIYFAKSNIYLKISELRNAKTSLKNGLKIESNNYKAIFQLGNILLMEKNYSEAITLFNKSLNIKPNFWQAINNKGLAYFEKNNINLSTKLFEEAITIEENAEPLLGLASCLRTKNLILAIELAKRALNKNPNYVNYDYRKEQLWGEKLQTSTEILLTNDQLQKDVILAKSKINKSS